MDIYNLTLNDLCKIIEKIFDIDGTEIKFSKLYFKIEKRRWSSTYSKVLYIDDVPCTCVQMRTFKVHYTCRCGAKRTILLRKFVCKKTLTCPHCIQDRSFEYNKKTNPYSLKKGIRQKPVYKEKTFDSMSEEYKENYKNKHLTKEEFFYYLPIIYSLNGIVFTEEIKNKIKYDYIQKTNNQSYFCPRFSIDDGKTWYALGELKLQCKTCGKFFTIHLQNIRKQNVENPICKTCKFTNTIYTIREYNNHVTYQSNLEKEFLDFCTENNICVQNGPTINYFHDNIYKKYTIDFFLPDLKMFVEIKGSNHFYRQDLQSGRIEAKNNAAIEYAKKKNMMFEFVRDISLEKFMDKLINLLNK